MPKPTGEQLRRLFQTARHEAGGLSYHTWDSRGSDTGFPDLVDLARHGTIAYVEFKCVAERLTAEQDLWIDRLRAAGARVYVCRPGNAISVAHALGLPHLAPVLADLGCGDAPAVPGERPPFDPDTATDLDMAQELLRLGVPALTIGRLSDCSPAVRRLNYERLYIEALNSKRGG